MTKEQTRQLGIEFERRIQLMYSQAEVVDKLSTDVIYAKRISNKVYKAATYIISTS